MLNPPASVIRSRYVKFYARKYHNEEIISLHLFNYQYVKGVREATAVYSEKQMEHIHFVGEISSY